MANEAEVPPSSPPPLHRGLQQLLPEELPAACAALISAFYGAQTALCRYRRLCINDVLHDGFVLEESRDDVIVLMSCGVSLRVPREDIGGSEWLAPPDVNPHSLRQLTARWCDAIMERTRSAGVESIEVHDVVSHGHTVHRRVRFFAKGETKAAPKRPPVFAYIKFFFPSMALSLRPVTNPDSYMREVATYSLLPDHHPAIAPLHFHTHFDPVTGSRSCVLEDASARYAPLTRLISTAAEAKPLMCALANLHGRYLQPGGEGERALQSALVHQRIFVSAWCAALKDKYELGESVQRMYGSTPTTPSTVTLIHGSINAELGHIMFAREKRATPNTLLVDWKHSGIAPLEVDLVSVYTLVLAKKERKAIIMELLEEYCAYLRDVYGVALAPRPLMMRMKEVALLLGSADAFDWNAKAKTKEAFAKAHVEMAYSLNEM